MSADEKQPSSALWSMVRTSVIGRIINRLAGPFVDAQIMAAVHEYFPKARLIPHARVDVLHIETRLSHVTRKFVHTSFTMIMKDPMLDELLLAMEVGGYKALVFGFTPFKVLWFPGTPDFYMLDRETWENYRQSLDNIEIGSVLIPDVTPSLPLE